MDNNEIAVSVVCNTYNHEKYIRDALEGFVTQKTSFNFEVLVHDDASTDKTAEIIREYEEKYPEIIKPIYQTENQYSQGIRVTRTYQCPRIKGKYVAFCEGDDYWIDPLKLQKQYDFMEANPEYTLCTCSTVWYNMLTQKKEKKCCTDVDKDISLEEVILEKKGRIFQLATFFMPADFYQNPPDWVASFTVGDYPLSLYAATCGKIRMLSDTMTVYRYSTEGSWTSRAENIEYRTKAMMSLIDGLNVFNENTDYKYNDIVIRKIKLIKYNLARKKRDFKALKSEELKEIYYSKDFMHRMADFMMCKFPKIYSFLMKMLNN